MTRTDVLADQAADRPAEDAGRADLGEAEHPEELAVAGQGFGQERRDGLEGLVPGADAGPSRHQDGVDLGDRPASSRNRASSGRARRGRSPARGSGGPRPRPGRRSGPRRHPSRAFACPRRSSRPGSTTSRPPGDARRRTGSWWRLRDVTSDRMRTVHRLFLRSVRWLAGIAVRIYNTACVAAYARMPEGCPTRKARPACDGLARADQGRSGRVLGAVVASSRPWSGAARAGPT